MNRIQSAVRPWSLSIPLLLALSCAGCLISETTQFTITMNDDGKTGTIVTVMRNIQSEETDGERQAKDFDEAIRAWKGDDYLLERMREGLYVKDRALSVEGDQLVWKETALFSDLGDVFRHEYRNDTLRFVIKEGQSVVATNGTLLSTKDSTTVFWALNGTKELSLTTRADSFSSRSDFAARFRKYLKAVH